MNTYNLSLAFGTRAIATLVCYSEVGLDLREITAAASTCAGEIMGIEYSPREYAQCVCDAIRSQCSCQVAIIMADAILPLVSGSTKGNSQYF